MASLRTEASWLTLGAWVFEDSHRGLPGHYGQIVGTLVSILLGVRKEGL